jgi:hypothetical protein
VRERNVSTIDKVKKNKKIMTNYTSGKNIGNRKWRRNLCHIARTLFLT